MSGKENKTGTYKYDPKQGKVVKVSDKVPKLSKSGERGGEGPSGCSHNGNCACCPMKGDF